MNPEINSLPQRSLPEVGADNAHAFLFYLARKLDMGESPDDVWQFCLDNAKEAKRGLATALNHYQKREGARLLNEA